MRHAFDHLDHRIAGWMRCHALECLRYSLAVLFIWFGILKPFGLSPDAALVVETIAWMPLLTPEQWVIVVGWWEVAIGLCFLYRPALRVAIGLLVLQMLGTFGPLIIMADVTWQPGRLGYAPTLIGQYIIKNLLIIAAALAVGGTVRDPDRLPRTKI